MKDSSDNIQVHLSQVPGTATELIIRHGEALPPTEPKAIYIEGQIGAPAEFIKKRSGVIDPTTTHVLISEQSACIALILSENNELHGKVVGKMLPNPDFTAFRINHGEWESPKALGEFLRKNRTYFSDDKDKFVKLVDSLTNFKARVEKELESSNDNRGNKRELVEQKISTQIPTAFIMAIPLHKYSDPACFEVEIYFDVRDAGCKITLQSIEAEELRRKEVIEAINEQLPYFEPYVTVFN